LEETTIIERVFELARSGECRNLVELRARLRREGYSQVEQHLRGPMIRAQLREFFASKNSG